MKYDFELDMESENTNSIIINQIEPNTCVLEFGPATGRMTKYLKEVLNCKVYIVEIDKSSFSKSINFAIQGINEDISILNWYEEFKEIKFDYVVFADVLEHLSDPEIVLKRSSQLLAENGKLIVSLPNIAHDAVIIDLINNKFEYRKLGILDNTHLKFFTRQSIRNLFEKQGLTVIRENAIYKNVEETEFGNCYNDIPARCSVEIKNRPYHNVYQFIFTATKTDYYINNIDKIEIINNLKNDIAFKMINVSVEMANGYEIKNYLQKRIQLGDNEINFKINKKDNVKNLIIELPSSMAVIKIYETYINNKYIEVAEMYTNATSYKENYFCFKDTEKAFLQINYTDIVEEFKIKFYYQDIINDVLLIDKYIEIIEMLKYNSLESNKKINELTNKLNQYKADNEIQQLQIQNNISKLKETKCNCEEKNSELKISIEQQKNQIKELNKIICEQENQIKESNKIICEQENQIKESNKIICEQENHKQEINIKLVEKEKEGIEAQQREKVIREENENLSNRIKKIEQGLQELNNINDNLSNEKLQLIEDLKEVKCRWYFKVFHKR